MNYVLLLVILALGAGGYYEYTTIQELDSANKEKFADLNTKVDALQAENKKLEDELSQEWWHEPPGLDWKYFNSKNNPLPPNYHWSEWRRDNPDGPNKEYVLLPDKGVLWCRSRSK